MINPTLKPINKIAAIVVQPGTHFTPKINFDCHDEREIQPPIQSKRLMRRSGVGYLIGHKKDWLTVIGLSSEKRNRWVCRCVCGRYVFRTAKTLKRKTNQLDKCIVCKKLEYLSLKTSSIK